MGENSGLKFYDKWKFKHFSEINETIPQKPMKNFNLHACNTADISFDHN